MNLNNAIEHFKYFSPLVWIMLIGNFFVRASYYMVWPFLSVILYEKYQLSATEVGLLLTGSAAFSVFLGFYTGNLADRFGRLKMLYIAVITGIVSFTALAFANSLLTFCVSVFLATLPRALWEAPSKALLSDEIKHDESRELALHMLYFLVNVGAAIGPLYGLWAGLNGEQFSFIYTAVAYLILLFALLIKHHRYAHYMRSASDVTLPNFSNWLSILRKDTLFLLVLVANLLIYLVFAQGDSSLVQYLVRADVPELAKLISMMIVANSTIIVLFQFPLLHLMRHYSIETRLYIGGFVLVLSQVMMALNEVDAFHGWLVCIVVLSVSEAILFSNINVYLDRLAPNHLKASYFGAAGLCSLGYAFAPLYGGVVLDVANGVVLFTSCALISLFALSLYYFAQKIRRVDTFVTTE